MTKFDKFILTAILLWAFGTAVVVGMIQTKSISFEIENQTQTAKRDCANSGHTWQQCNDKWLTSGAYKTPENEQLPLEWQIFIMPK